MNLLVHRVTFIAGCLLLLIGAVFIFKGSTPVANYIGNGISILGLLISFIQMYFPTPIFIPKSNTSGLHQQNSTPSEFYAQSSTLKNTSYDFSSMHSKFNLKINDFIFFIICFISLPIITFIKTFNYHNSPFYQLSTVSLSAIIGIGIYFLFLAIDINYKNNKRTEDEDIYRDIYISNKGLRITLLSLLVIVIFCSAWFLFSYKKNSLAITYSPALITILISSAITTLSTTWASSFFRLGKITRALLNLAFFALLVFANLLYIALILEPHFFLTFNASSGSFDEQSYNLFAPDADLNFLTATLALLFGTVCICQETKEIFGSVSGAIIIMFGIGLLLFQITTITVVISAINILLGIVMFLVAHRS